MTMPFLKLLFANSQSAIRIPKLLSARLPVPFSLLSSPGPAAGGNSPDRNPDRGSASSICSGSKHCANGCASSGMSKEKTLSLSTDMRMGSSHSWLTLQPNWSVSKLTSSSPPARIL